MASWSLSFLFGVIIMRYHYEKPSIFLSMYGRTYICDHPVHNSCTLFEINNKGLAVIQQRFNEKEKTIS